MKSQKLEKLEKGCVVAGEVKNPANQKAKTTDDISAQILSIQEATEDAVSAIRRISSIIMEINQISEAISTAIQQQTAATQEIASNIQHVWQGTTKVVNSIVHITPVATDSAVTASHIATGVRRLSEQLNVPSRKNRRYIKELNGAAGENRTLDPTLTKGVLHH